MSIITALESLAPALNYSEVYATPTSLKKWGAHRGPRANVAAFTLPCATPEAAPAASLKSVLHSGGARTSCRLFMMGIQGEAC